MEKASPEALKIPRLRAFAIAWQYQKTQSPYFTFSVGWSDIAITPGMDEWYRAFVHPRGFCSQRPQRNWILNHSNVRKENPFLDRMIQTLVRRTGTVE